MTPETIADRINAYWKTRGINAGAKVRTITVEMKTQIRQIGATSFYLPGGKQALRTVTSKLTGMEHDPTANASFDNAYTTAQRLRKQRPAGRPPKEPYDVGERNV